MSSASSLNGMFSLYSIKIYAAGIFRSSKIVVKCFGTWEDSMSGWNTAKVNDMNVCITSAILLFDTCHAMVADPLSKMLEGYDPTYALLCVMSEVPIDP
jgi:hypothetical protein